MNLFLKITRAAALILLLLQAQGPLLAQEASTEKQKPDQLNIFKVNLSQFAINEARLLYEIQLRKTTSLELGAGYIYPNRALFEQAGNTMLSSGFSGYVSFRKYFDKKRYIYQPFFRSYTGFTAFTKFNQFDNEWLQFGTGIDAQCELFSRKQQQFGGALRFGFQSRAGRLVLDMYSGIGMKVVTGTTISHALNDSTTVCAPLPQTQYREISERGNDVEVVLNVGLQVGIRQNNREKAYKEGKKEEQNEVPDSPPQF